MIVQRTFQKLVNYRSSALVCIYVFSLVNPLRAQEPHEVFRGQIVAEVNDTKISKRALNKELNRQLRKELSYFDQAATHMLRRQMLERMIERELLFQAAKRKNLVPSPVEVTSYVDTMKKGIYAEELLGRELLPQEMSEKDFAQDILEGLAIRRYMETQVFGELTVSEEELRKAYRNDPMSYSEPEEVRARHILLRVSVGGSEDEVLLLQQKAEKIAALARQEGRDFPDLAKKYSQAPNSGKGGDLGFFTREQLNADFSREAFALGEGEVSDPVRTKFGFHIIKVEEKRGGGTAAFAEVKEKIRARISREKMGSLLSQHLKDLRQGSSVIVYYQ